MAETLRNKTIKGVSWSFFDSIASQGITFLVGIVLANILTPKEYGVVGIVTIFIAILNSLVDSGFSNALIRKQDVKQIDYNTVFIFNLLFSVILVVIFYFLTPYISYFFDEPQLIPLMRVMGCIIIINAFSIIHRTILVKNVDFKTQTKVSLIASVVSGVIGLGMAICDYGVWSLAGQQISRQFLNSILLWFFNKWRPLLEFSYESFKELFSYGSKILLSGLVDTIFKQINSIVIGKFYTPAVLGQYSRAKQFSSIFSANLTLVIQRVSFPILSSIQNDKNQLVLAYRKILKPTMFISFICMVAMASTAEQVILLLIGEQWIQAIEYLQIICLIDILYPMRVMNLNLFQVCGRSDLILKLSIIKRSIEIIPICLGMVNIKYMLWGFVITGCVGFLLNAYYTGRLLNYGIVKQLKDVFPSIFVSVIVGVSMLMVSTINFSTIIILIIQMVVGTVVMLLVSRIMNYNELKEIVKLLKPFICKKNKEII